MGPQATIDLYSEVIAQTPAQNDQDHIKTIIYSNPKVPDRTQAIVAHGENPVPYLLEGVKFLEKAGADFILIPCNTAHYYLSKFEKEIAIPILNMIELTIEYISEQFSQVKKVGILSTTGTLRTRIYQDSIERHGLKVITSKSSDQENLVMKAIYHIKANINLDDAAQQLRQAAQKLADRGAEVIIMGCTEIPLALKQKDISIPLIDPKKIIARRAVFLALA